MVDGEEHIFLDRALYAENLIVVNKDFFSNISGLNSQGLLLELQALVGIGRLEETWANNSVKFPAHKSHTLRSYEEKAECVRDY